MFEAQPSGNHPTIFWGFNVKQAGRQLLDEREMRRVRGRKGGDVHIIAGGWRRGEWGSMRGECVRDSSAGGWAWAAAARRLPSLAISAGETKAERGCWACRRAFFLTDSQAGFKERIKGRAIHDVMEQTQPALVSCEETKVERVTGACDLERGYEWDLQKHGFILRLFPSKTQSFRFFLTSERTVESLGLRWKPPNSTVAHSLFSRHSGNWHWKGLVSS